jgi:hypothetical protein
MNRNNESPFDTAPDREDLLTYLMWHQNGPQRREAALENLRSLDAFGLAQLRGEMRHNVREAQRGADSCDPFAEEWRLR